MSFEQTPRHRADEPSVEPLAPTARSSRRRRIVLGLMLVLFAWAVVVPALVLGAAGNLDNAEQLLPVARDAVAEADLETAKAVLDEARAELSDAKAGLNNPLVVPFRSMPVLGADLRVATAIADGGAAVGDAVGDAVATLESMPEGIGALAPVNGVFPVEAIQQLAPPLQRTADAVADAVLEIESTTASGRIERITSGRERVLGLLAPVATQAETAAQLAARLPAFLGADGPRTYLFGASTPAELRGTGGFIGSISLLRIDKGRPEFGTFEPANDLPVLAPAALPTPVSTDAKRWSRYDGTGHFLTLNRTPHFPAAARAMTQHWEATRGDTVDGIIVVDPFALEALLELTGPTEVPGYDARLDADSVVAFVSNEAYSVFDDEDERKAVLGAVSAATLKRFLDAGTDAAPPSELMATLSGLAAGGHVVAHAEDPDTQRAFSLAGLAGELRDPDGDLVNVIVNSGSASKIDYYAERHIDHEVTLLRDGAAHSSLRVTILNDAPTAGQPVYVIGRDSDAALAGTSLSDVSVYLAKRAVFSEVPTEDDGMPSFTETELGHPVHDGWVRLPSGEQVDRLYAWTTPDAWTTSPAGILEYEVLFQGQTVIRPTELSLRVNIPAGFEVLDLPAGASVEDDQLVWTASVRGEDVTLRVQLRPVRDS